MKPWQWVVIAAAVLGAGWFAFGRKPADANAPTSATTTPQVPTTTTVPSLLTPTPTIGSTDANRSAVTNSPWVAALLGLTSAAPVLRTQATNPTATHYDASKWAVQVATPPTSSTPASAPDAPPATPPPAAPPPLAVVTSVLSSRHLF